MAKRLLASAAIAALGVLPFVACVHKSGSPCEGKP